MKKVCLLIAVAYGLDSSALGGHNIASSLMNADSLSLHELKHKTHEKNTNASPADIVNLNENRNNLLRLQMERLASYGKLKDMFLQIALRV